MIKKPIAQPIIIKNKTQVPSIQTKQAAPSEDQEDIDVGEEDTVLTHGQINKSNLQPTRTNGNKLPNPPKQNKKDLPNIIFSSIDLQTQQLSGTYNAKNVYDAAKHCFISRNRMRSIRREVQLENEIITMINLSNKEMHSIKLTRYATTSPTMATIGGKEVIFKSNIVYEEVPLPK